MGLAYDVGVLLWSLIKILFETIAGWVMPTKYKSVEGEVCLITGAANGIGRLMALEFARRKATLVLWDIDEKGLREAERLVRDIGAQVFIDVCDVSDRENIKKAAEKARQQIGDVTILINNAGIVYCKELMKLTEHQIEQTFKVNTLAPFWTVREFLPHMLDSNHGHIVTIASTVGLFASPGMPDYCASKHAAVGFHQSMYFDLQNSGKKGVNTTLVCPYLITTGMFKGVNVDRPALLPPVAPEDCVERIMHSVLSNKRFVAIPRTMYLSYYLTTVLPMAALYASYKFTGAHRAISRFIPNRPYQIEAYKED